MPKSAVVETTPLSCFERRRRMRRVRMIVDLTIKLIRTDELVTYDEAMKLVSCARKSIAEILPGYEARFEMRVRPRMERIIQRRWPLERAMVSSHELVN